MKKKRFSVEQIIGVLKQAQAGVPVAEVIRKAAIYATDLFSASLPKKEEASLVRDVSASTHPGNSSRFPSVP